MKPKGNGLVKISESDRALFKLLLQQKALTLDLINRWLCPDDPRLLKGKRPNTYFRLNRLIKAGYLKRQTLEGMDLYLLTQGGLDIIRDLNTNSLPLVTISELEMTRHDILTADIRFYLESYGASGWISDRELRLHEDQLPQVPDGACTIASLTVFIEVELSQKGRDRYDKIAQVYTAPKGPDRVLYFYKNDSVVEYLKGLVAGHERIGFFKYPETVGPPASVTGVCASEDISLAGFLNLPC